MGVELNIKHEVQVTGNMNAGRPSFGEVKEDEPEYIPYKKLGIQGEYFGPQLDLTFPETWEMPPVVLRPGIFVGRERFMPEKPKVDYPDIDGLKFTDTSVGLDWQAAFALGENKGGLFGASVLTGMSWYQTADPESKNKENEDGEEDGVDRYGQSVSTDKDKYPVQDGGILVPGHPETAQVKAGPHFTWGIGLTLRIPLGSVAAITGAAHYMVHAIPTQNMDTLHLSSVDVEAGASLRF